MLSLEAQLASCSHDSDCRPRSPQFACIEAKSATRRFGVHRGEVRIDSSDWPRMRLEAV
jgi:hypothetical protein